MPKSTRELVEEREKLMADNERVLKAADAEGRALSAEERQEWDKRDADVEAINAEIEGRNALKERADRAERYKHLREQAAGRQTEENPINTDRLPERLKIKIREREIALRPGSEEAMRAQPKYEEAFTRYLMGSRGEMLGLQTGKNDQGGYLVPMAFIARLIKFVDDALVFRQLANVLPPLTDAVSLGIPTWETDPNDADWTPEVPASDISEDDAARLGKRELMPHDLSKLVKVSTKMLRAGAIDLDTFLPQRLAYKLRVPMEKAYMVGDGASKPLGVFVASNDGISTARDVTSAATAFTWDDLVDVQEGVKANYQDSAVWLAHRDFYKACRKIKDGDGLPIWNGARDGQPTTLMGRPAIRSEFAPNDLTSGKYGCVYGDLKAGYYIVDGLNTEVQRLNELGALRKQVLYLGSASSDGMPVLEEAFSRMKLA